MTLGPAEVTTRILFWPICKVLMEGAVEGALLVLSDGDFVDICLFTLDLGLETV